MRSARSAVVKRSVLIRARPEEIYPAFQDDASLQVWYFDEARVDFRVGGQLTFQGPEGSVPAQIVEISAPDKLVLAYDAPWWGTVTFQLEPSDSGTRVSVVHEGFEGREEWIDRFAWGWESILKELKAYVERKPAR